MLPLDEFREALKDEIEVAKRNSSNAAVPLTNGHKVMQLGSAFQYAFLIDSVLNTPDGAPGDLKVPGKPPLEVTIVSAEGLRLVVSVNTDLGQFIPTARLQSNLTLLMRKLIERIEKNASNENPAALACLGKPVQGEPKPIWNQANLNEGQLKALQSALGRNLTFIWGPPGTGKTHTIGTIAEYLHREKRTVLIVSHTNNAVDQAIRHVAETFKKERPDDLSRGGLLRLGEVRDEGLRSGFPDVLLTNQVERRSKELAEKREELSFQKQTFLDKLSDLEKRIAILEWVTHSEPDIRSTREQLQTLHNKEYELALTERNLSGFSEKHSELMNLERLAEQAILLKKKLFERKNEETKLRQKLEKLLSDSTAASARIKDQENRAGIAERITPLRKELASYPPLEELTSTIATLTERMHEFDRKLSARKAEHGVAHNILEEATNTGAMMRLWKGLPKPEDQQIVVTRLRQQIAKLNEEHLNIQRSLDHANRILTRTQELNAMLSKYAHIGEYSIESEKHKDALRAQESLKKDISEIGSKIADMEKTISQFQKELQACSSTFNASPEDVLSNVHMELQRFAEMTERVKTQRSEAMITRSRLTGTLAHMIECLYVWGLISEKPNSVENMLELVNKKHAAVASSFSNVNLSSLRDKAGKLRSEASRLSSEISRIEEILSQIEKTIIAEASIIGVTLTKAYLSDDIQARKFDTVILDEASMAPIPALWAAALLAEKNLIIVGDFKQLPPIVLSNKELTKKWLGRDIFEASGIRGLWENGEPPDYFIPLTEQHRMLPQIADIANQFYDGILETPPYRSNFSQEDLYEWYNKDWPHGNEPVLLVDTGSLNAWVTSVVKNGNTSRLNFLSATVAVDIAEQLLRPDRPKKQEGAPKRIIIVSPYRAHAKLVSLLVKENKALQDDVISGTAHSFQGSEAHVVIFDLVADDPHWKVNLFMSDLDEQIKRLLNVSLTRAKFRLIILGDFEYCREHAKKAYLGKSLLPNLLKKFPRVDAAKLVPDGLAARAAKAHMTMLGGEIEPDSDRVVVTQADFYRILSADLQRASKRIIIYSPFMTQDRIGFLLPQLRAATEGVFIYVITKAHSERSRTELPQYKKLESQLISEVGAVVIHKLRMHEKLVFIDDDITWAGSLNPLSFSSTQEIMERRKSATVLQDYFKTLRLEELLSVQEKPESRCPICGSEMIAAEGADEPYYWRCVNDDCYTRSIDQPYPLDGMLPCVSCNAPVQFGDWGGYPHWRCSSNKMHRQKIFKSHLRLPKMAALVPKSERRKVCKKLGIDNFESFVDNTHQRGAINAQISLFETEPEPKASSIPESVTHSAKPIILDTAGDTVHSCSIVEMYDSISDKRYIYNIGFNKDKPGYLSPDSQVGQALIGHKLNEFVELVTPFGIRSMKIVKIMNR